MFDQPAVRGQIQHRERARQIAEFKGLTYNKITPTDLDGFLDFGDKLFIFIESKFIATPILRGQELAIERLCDGTHCPPRRYAFAIVADHCHPVTEDIEFSDMTVRSIRQNGAWNAPMNRALTVRDAIDRMVATVENRLKQKIYRRAA
jgi:hypothetical protein